MLTFGIVFLCLVYTCCGKILPEECVEVVGLYAKLPNPKVIHVNEKGNLHGPKFENSEGHLNQVQCIYRLKTLPGMHVRLKFNMLGIDATDNCKEGSITIYDVGSYGQMIPQGILCGDQLPYDYVSSSNILEVFLKTNLIGYRRGFNITYSCQSTTDMCSSGLKQCRNRNCVEYSKLCNGNDDCGDGTDEEKCSRLISDEVQCGVPDIKPLDYFNYDRIVGGMEAVKGSWPWMADIHYKLVELNGHHCGGALINAQWVLTAAHCFEQGFFRRPDELRIHLGKHNKFQKDEGEQIRLVERIVIYDDIPSEVFEKNGEFDRDHDIALVKLNAPVKFTKYVKPVCLPDSNTQLNKTDKCFATGWGFTRGTGNSDVLKQAYHPIESDAHCSRLVKDMFNPHIEYKFNNQTMICAGSQKRKNGVCHYDGGGPLVCELNKVWKIVGVTSYAIDISYTGGMCGLEASVFSKVQVKTEWIRRMINRYT